MSDRPFLSDRARRNPEGTVTLRLRQSINVEGKSVSALTFQPLKVRHLLKLDTIVGPRARVLSLIQSSAHIPAPSIEEMSGLDFLDCDEIVSDFLDRAPLIAAPSPPISPLSSTGLSETSDD